MGDVDAVRRRRDAQQHELGRGARPLAVERDRGCGCDLGEVAIAGADLVEPCSGSRCGRRDLDRDQELVRLERGLVRAAEEGAGGDRPLPAGRPNLELRIEGDHGAGQLRPRCGESQRAADGAAMTGRQVAGEPAGGVEQRLRPARDLVVEECLLAGERPDPERPVALLDAGEPRNAVDVDDDRRLDDAGLQQRHEALTTRENARAVSGSEEREHLLDRVGGVVGERRGLHAAARTSSRGSGAFALRRYSIVVKIRSASPALARSWIIDSPAANESRRVSPTS